MLAPIFDSAQQQFNITSNSTMSIVTIPPVTLSREFTVAWWAFISSTSYASSAPRLLHFASASSGYTVQAVLSANGYWCGSTTPKHRP